MQLVYLKKWDQFKATCGEGLKRLTPQQMFQSIQSAFVQVNAGNIPENSLNEIH